MNSLIHIEEGPQKMKGGNDGTGYPGPSVKRTAMLKKALAVLLYTAAWALVVYGFICWVST